MVDSLTIKHYEMPVSVNAQTMVRWGKKCNTHATHSFYKHAGEEVIQILNQSNPHQLLSFLASLNSSPISISMTMYKSWRTKKGNIRVNDVENYMKSETDLIFKCINKWLEDNISTYSNSNSSLPLFTLDDSQVFEVHILKVESKIEQIEIEIKKFKEVIICQEML
jgi:Holliday junction resolvase RusA-like endonuclease